MLIFMIISFMGFWIYIIVDFIIQKKYRFVALGIVFFGFSSLITWLSYHIGSLNARVSELEKKVNQ